jgi:hypothetical protein
MDENVGQGKQNVKLEFRPLNRNFIRLTAKYAWMDHQKASTLCKCSYMWAETRLVNLEGAAVARERPIYTFPRQQTHDATTEELLTFSISYRCSMK